MRNKKKAILIGMDGVEYKIVERMTREGKLKNLNSLTLHKAYSGGIEGTNQETALDSIPQWSSILTGTQLNKHHVEYINKINNF